MLRKILAVFPFLLAPALCPAQGVPIGFEETWALAQDRRQALAQLIPGTPQHFYYSCRYHQDRGEFAKAATLLATFAQRHGRTAQVREIEARQALLNFDGDTAAGYRFLRQQLGLRFDHQRPRTAAQRGLASRLDGAQLSEAAFLARALARRSSSTRGIDARLLPQLLDRDLPMPRLRDVLNRLQWADHPDLPRRVVQELRDRRSRGFGRLKVHGLLTRAQLDACAQLMPELLDQASFVQAYLKRLLPDADRADLRDPEVRNPYLDRLESFARRLGPVHNSLKAQVLHHQLRRAYATGRVDRPRLLEYLRLPRRRPYTNPDYLRRLRRGARYVEFQARLAPQLAPVGNDNQLLRDLLLQEFRDAEDYQAFAPLLRIGYLRRLFAEAKILAGIGDMDRWYQLLDDPAYYEALKQRVDLRFAPQNKQRFAADEQVVLELDVKNIAKLIVKVFEIQAFNYYQARNREIDARIPLDGLVANHQRNIAYEEPGIRRLRRRFEFPELSKPGVYVVEFIGNGVSSRAVVHKGALSYTARSGAAGQVLTLRDAAGRPQPGAEAWLGTRKFIADAKGEVLLPYSTRPGRRTLILRKGRICSRVQFDHFKESYGLVAGIHVDRESLLARQQAKVLIRPRLYLNGVPVSLELLEEPVLEILATDQGGTEIRQEVAGLKLGADGETMHRIQVPEGLRLLRLRLRGKVAVVSTNKPKQLASNQASFGLNQIEASSQTDCPLLGRTPEGYVIDVLGKDGEPRVGRALRLSLRHRGFSDAYTQTLKTDARGRVYLGPLVGIRTIQASGFPRGIGSWVLPEDRVSLPGALHGRVGETLRIPYAGISKLLTRRELALFALRGGVPAADAFDRLRLVDGQLEIAGLAAGDYRLSLKTSGTQIPIRIAAGDRVDGYVVGAERQLELSPRGFLQIRSLRMAGDQLEVQLDGVSATTRVHLAAGRYLPPYAMFAQLSLGNPAARQWFVPARLRSSYHSERALGDEHRYILERRFAKKFPGNMLERPGLILNPWRLEDVPWDTQMEGEARKGGFYAGSEADSNKWNTAVGLGGGAGGKFGGSRPGVFANLEFLGEPAVVLSNLRPDARGRLQIPVARLGRGHLIQVCAVDAFATASRSLVRPEQPLRVRSRALDQALDANQHLTERRRLEFVPAGKQVQLRSGGGSEAEVYDSLAAVHGLFLSLSGNQDLSRFGFLLQWPDYTAARKAELYEEFACHELHVFLRQKDPAFFKAVVRPYLANKRDQTFLDHWLLDADLRRYLEPWAFDQLNVVEQILLARRLGDAGIRRRIREIFASQERDPRQLAKLFGAVLKSKALEAGEKSLGKNVRGSLERLRRAPARKPGRPAPAGPTTPGPGGPASPNRPVTGGLPAKSEAAKTDPAAPAEQPNADAQDGFDGRELRQMRKDLDRRAQTQRLFRAVAATKPQVEHNYWHRRQAQASPDMIRIIGFWRDFALHPDGQPFVSRHVPEASGSFAEMVLALAFLDLPFQAGEHQTRTEGHSFTLTAKSHLLLARRELAAVQAAEPGSAILVNQNYYRLDRPYRQEDGQRVDAYVDEFVVGVAYGCRVVVTNTSSTPRGLDLLLQIPKGAIPVQNGFVTHSRQLRLEGYATQAISYAFYFPRTGAQAHYPVQVAQGGKLLAAAEARELQVLQEPSKVDTSSWSYLAQAGSNAQVLTYLDGANLQRLDLDLIAWRLRDKAFFGGLLQRLRQRRHYHNLSWSYGVWHQDRAAVKEFLPYQQRLVALCGAGLDAPILEVDLIRRRAYEQVEFTPLIHARAHRFGKQRRILDRNVATQYRAFLAVLGAQKQLDARDLMALSYYLLLQDRVEEALKVFARIDASELRSRLQYDYMRAYLDLFEGDTRLAAELADRYRDHPVRRWRKRFRSVAAQLAEVAGEGVAQVDPKNREQELARQADRAASMELKVDGQTLQLDYRNLESCTLRYYQMDVELLFSSQPFVQQGAGSFAFIKPNLQQSRSLDPKQRRLSFDIPAQFRGRNVLVEVEGAGVIRRVPCYARSMKVQFYENQGQLQVTQGANKPLSTAYVKVYARLADGRVRFFKDGYTDLRGRFDYSSLSVKEAASVRRFAVLVLHEAQGALVRELDPPAR